jgi:HTH-type transcriptional regulator, competence development regulator
MRIDRTKGWWLALADSEGDEPVGVGLSARGPDRCAGALHPVTPPAEGTLIAFGKLVELMRRRSKLSVEQLADKASLDVSELMKIEEGMARSPEPRTVYRLAQTFKLPEQRLMQLAGLAVANDSGLQLEAVRFAARSESIQKLTREENAALEAFIAVLSRQEPKKAQ